MVNFTMFNNFVSKHKLQRNFRDTENFYKYEEYIGTSRIDPSYLDNTDGNYETFIACYLIYGYINFTDSVNLLKDAITKGNIVAMYEMGWYLEDLEYSFDEAIKYYKMVIEHELSSENKEIIAKSYKQLGRIVPDVEEGVEFYKKAHEMGHPTASYYLGEHYMEREYRDEEQMEYYMSHILKDVNNVFYDHAIGNMMVFYDKKDFNKVIDLAYLRWLKNKGTSQYKPIYKYLKKVTDLNKLLEISIKINDFEEFFSRKITEHFMKFENIDHIFHNLKVISLNKHLIDKFTDRFFKKYSMIINTSKGAEKLPSELVKKIILFI